MTYILIILTSIISILAFNNHELFSKLQFNAYQIFHRKEWYRMISHGFLHADWTHLLINMLVLYFFGTATEEWLKVLESEGLISMYRLVYVIFYLVAIVIASTLSLIKHRNDIWYNSVGASGAASAVLFFNIFFDPWGDIQLYFVISIPGIILGVFYLIYSHIMSRKQIDNINHDAHFIGAVFGFVFPLILKPGLIHHFIAELRQIG